MGSLEKKMHLVYMSSLSILFQAKFRVLHMEKQETKSCNIV